MLLEFRRLTPLEVLTLPLVSTNLPLVQTNHHAQLNALGDATRRGILSRLLNGPLPVGELAKEFPVSRPAISQHLKILKEAKLVVDVPSGNRRLYQLNPEGFDSLRDFCDHFWTQALAAFKEKVEQEK